VWGGVENIQALQDGNKDVGSNVGSVEQWLLSKKGTAIHE